MIPVEHVCPGCGVRAATADAEHLIDCPYQGSKALPFAGYDYEADIARGSNIRKPGERPWEASRRLRRERGLDDA